MLSRQWQSSFGEDRIHNSCNHVERDVALSIASSLYLSRLRRLLLEYTSSPRQRALKLCGGQTTLLVEACDDTTRYGRIKIDIVSLIMLAENDN
jgi:hypothetical protein